MTAQAEPMETYSLRSYLREIVDDGSLRVVQDDVSLDVELMDVMWQLKREGDSPVVWFDQVDNLLGEASEYPVLVNLFGDRQRCAKAIDSTIREVSQEYGERERQENHREPDVVSRDEAAVVDEVATDDAVDLNEFPIVTSHEQDAGPYLTAGVCIVPAPPGKEEWGYNAGTLRMEVKDDDTLAVYAVPGFDTHKYFMAYEEAGENMPIAVMIGHHPAFYLGSQTSAPTEVDEYEAIGGILERPTEVTPSKTFGDDLLIPANGEIVLEGEVIADERIEEGPFGEFTGYYGEGGDDRYRIELSTVQNRADAIYLNIWPGQADHLFLGVIPTEGKILESVQRSVPTVQNVYSPPSGAGRFHCYIQIDKQRPGQGKNAIIAALSAFDWIKHVIVVDDDVDIFDETEVLWAVATRSQWDEDLIVQDGFSTLGFEPSAAAKGTTARGGIDATVPLDADFPDKLLPGDTDVDELLASMRVAETVPE